MAEQKGKYSLFILLFILFAVYCFIFGDSGLLERQRLAGEKARLESRIDDLEKENRELNDLHENYRKGSYLKEEALKSGYISQDEKALFYKDGGPENEKPGLPRTPDERFDLKTSHLRILWVVFSIMVILIFYLIRMRYRKDEVI